MGPRASQDLRSPSPIMAPAKTSLALFSYVQTTQFAPYCQLDTSSRCAELGCERRYPRYLLDAGLSDCARSSVL